MDSGGIVVEVDGSYSHIFLDCLHPWDVVLPISIEHFGLLHLWSLSYEDHLWSFGNAILFILLPESTNEP
jgi:hypothetical protein